MPNDIILFTEDLPPRCQINHSDTQDLLMPLNNFQSAKHHRRDQIYTKQSAILLPNSPYKYQHNTTFYNTTRKQIWRYHIPKICKLANNTSTDTITGRMKKHAIFRQGLYPITYPHRLRTFYIHFIQQLGQCAKNPIIFSYVQFMKAFFCFGGIWKGWWNFG